jgi:hypothetical protein
VACLKIVSKPSTLSSFYSKCLVGYPKPLQSWTTVKLDKDGVHAASLHLNVVSVFGHFKPDFFDSYESSGEYFVLTQTAATAISREFSGKQSLILETQQDKLSLQSSTGDLSYKEALIQPDTRLISNFPLKMSKSDVGFIPLAFKSLECKLHIKTTELELPESEFYTFEIRNQKVSATAQNMGTYTKILTLEPDSVLNSASLTTKVSNLYLKPVLSVLSDSVVWLPHPEAMILIDKSKNHAITYLIAARA